MQQIIDLKPQKSSGFAAGRLLARLDPRPTAVFAANDAMAIGLSAALREVGLEVPDDFSLVGFDDIPLARYLTPPLTTVRMPIAEVGGRAMERLLEVTAAAGAVPRTHEVVPPTLSIRRSTAPAPPAGGRSPTSSPTWPS